jgi:hypothetical protein
VGSSYPGAGTTVCGTSTLQSPYSASNDAPLGTTTNVVNVAVGDDNGDTLNTANTTYYFAPGSHNLGTGEYDQVQMGANDWYVGEYSGGTGATLTGQYDNEFGFISNDADAVSTATADHIEYFTIEGFTTYGAGASNADGASGYMDLTNSTLQDNYPGSGAEGGSYDTFSDNCGTSNGDYAINFYCSGTGCSDSALTTGPQDVTVADNEISYNDQCNYEAVPSGYFPITPPSQCGSVGNQGCGCAGGVHFWNVDGSNFSDNDVHNNYDVASWWDTDNNGETIEHNYYADNFQEAVDIEISYNALIEDNNFVDNAWGSGACGAAPGNACYTDGNLASAIYISESGGNPSVAGNAHGIGTLTIAGDNFDNNWDGVSLYQSSNRFCGSPDNTSTDYCTLVPGANAYYTGSGAAPAATYYDNGSASSGGCGSAELAGATSSASPDYYDNCLWKTQDVAVTGDTFSFDAAAIPGCTASSPSPCGENGLASQFPSGISWSPYQATAAGYAVPDAITNCTAGATYSGCTPQDDYFSDNTYTHTGSQGWEFYYRLLGNQVSISTWQSDGQDSGSSFS